MMHDIHLYLKANVMEALKQKELISTLQKLIRWLHPKSNKNYMKHYKIDIRHTMSHLRT